VNDEDDDDDENMTPLHFEAKRKKNLSSLTKVSHFRRFNSPRFSRSCSLISEHTFRKDLRLIKLYVFLSLPISFLTINSE